VNLQPEKTDVEKTGIFDASLPIDIVSLWSYYRQGYASGESAQDFRSCGSTNERHRVSWSVGFLAGVAKRRGIT